jgi:hypothetical protein
MNRIVKEHYPVAKLPEDLRESLKPDEAVRITIESDSMPDFDSIFPETAALLRRPKRVLMLDELFALQRSVYSSVEEIDEHVRSMRDERE